MTVRKEIIDQLASIPNVSVSEGVLLSEHTRFGIGGPADLFVQAASEQAFAEALRVARSSGAAYSVIGEGTNLIVSDQGFDGIVLRLTANTISSDGATFAPKPEPNCKRWSIIRSITACGASKP